MPSLNAELASTDIAGNRVDRDPAVSASASLATSQIAVGPAQFEHIPMRL